MRMTVADLMSNCFVKVPAECSADRALKILDRHKVTELYVTDKSGRLLGVLPDFEIIKAELSGEAAESTADRLMSRNIPVFNVDTDAAVVAREFRDARFHQFPVVQAGRLVGVIRRSDIIRLMAILRQIDGPSKLPAVPKIKPPKLLLPAVREKRSRPVMKFGSTRPSATKPKASSRSKARG